MAVTKALIPVNHQTRLKEAWHKRSYSINCHLEWRTCMCLISGIVYVIQSVKRYSLKLAFIFLQIRNGCSYWNNLPLKSILIYIKYIKYLSHSGISPIISFK